MLAVRSPAGMRRSWSSRRAWRSAHGRSGLRLVDRRHLARRHVDRRVRALARGRRQPLAAGVVGTWRRPRLPGAPLLMLAAMGWFIGEWSSPAAPVGGRLHHRPPGRRGVAGGDRPRERASRSDDGRPPVGALLVAGYTVCVGLLGDHPDDRVRAAGDRVHRLPGQPTRLARVTRADGDDRRGLASSSRPCGWRHWLSCSDVASIGRRGSARRLGLAVQLPALVSLVAVAADGLHSVSRGSLSNDRVDVALWAVSAAGLIGCAHRGDAAALAGTWRAPVRRADRARGLAAAPPLGELQRTLAAILDDPGLTIAYPIDSWSRRSTRPVTTRPPESPPLAAR